VIDSFRHFVVLTEHELEDGGEVATFSVMCGDLDRECTWHLVKQFDTAREAEQYANKRNGEELMWGRLVPGGEA